jgi:hypothetical protein
MIVNFARDHSFARIASGRRTFVAVQQAGPPQSAAVQLWDEEADSVAIGQSERAKRHHHLMANLVHWR